MGGVRRSKRPRGGRSRSGAARGGGGARARPVRREVGDGAARRGRSGERGSGSWAEAARRRPRRGGAARSRPERRATAAAALREDGERGRGRERAGWPGGPGAGPWPRREKRGRNRAGPEREEKRKIGPKEKF